MSLKALSLFFIFNAEHLIAQDPTAGYRKVVPVSMDWVFYYGLPTEHMECQHGNTPSHSRTFLRCSAPLSVYNLNLYCLSLYGDRGVSVEGEVYVSMWSLWVKLKVPPKNHSRYMNYPLRSECRLYAQHQDYIHGYIHQELSALSPLAPLGCLRLCQAMLDCVA